MGNSVKIIYLNLLFVKEKLKKENLGKNKNQDKN